MAADKNGFDPFPGTLRIPGPTNFPGPASAWNLPESLPTFARNPFTGDSYEYFYEGEGNA